MLWEEEEEEEVDEISVCSSHLRNSYTYIIGTRKFIKGNTRPLSILHNR